MSPLLSVIIVHFRTPDLLADCLKSLFAQTDTLPFEVIVVDNASGDESRDRVLGDFPAVRWIEMPSNQGFARANNAGIRAAKGQLVLLLNADTVVRENAVDQCHRRLRDSPYVAAGVALLNADGTEQISGNFLVRGGLNHLLAVPGIGPMLRRAGRLAGMRKPHLAERTAEAEVDWINGAFLMVKKSAIEKAGLLDEDFFLYAEEAEWCGRLQQAGPLVVYGDLQVLHLQGESANQAFGSGSRGYARLDDRKGLQIMISNLLRIRKQFGRGWLLVHFIAHTLGVPLFALIVLWQKFIGAPGEDKHAQSFAGYCRNVAVAWTYFPRIWSGRPYFYKML